MLTRLFDAPRALVFEAWTKAEHVVHWWDPTGTPLAVCEIDLRPNGAFRFVNRAPNGGEGHSFSGIYREITPPGRLVLASASGPGFSTLVFTEQRKKTKLTMTIECASKKDRDALLRMRVDAGTARTLDNLAAYLSTIARGEHDVERANGAEAGRAT